MSTPDSFCPKCGDRLALAARFCERCGHPVRGREVSGTTGTWDCPSCGAPAEPAHRVVERLRGGTSPDAGRGADLLDHLTEPPPPAPFPLGTWILFLVVPVLNVLSIFISPVRGALKVWVSVSAVVFVGFVIWSVTGTFEDPFAARDVTMAVGFTTFVLYSVALLSTWFREKAAVRRGLLPSYQKALERRRHLGFCDPCGIVFFDDRPGASAPLSRTADFVGEGGGQRQADVGRAPGWIWVVMTLVTVGGAALAASMAPGTGRPDPDPAEADVEEPWADLRPDEVQPELPVEERGGPGSLDAPLIADTAG